MLLTASWCMSVGECIRTFRAYVPEIVKLTL